MRTFHARLTASLLVSSALAVPARGQDAAPGVSLNFHLTEPSFSGCNDAAFDAIDQGSCADLASDPLSGPAFVWVVVSSADGFSNPGGADGIGGVEFGVEHTLGSPGWVACTGGLATSSHGWPASGGGFAAAWAGGCYEPPGRNARVGYFQVANGDAGSLSVIASPGSGNVQITNCDPDELLICSDAWGSADLAVGTEPGCSSSFATAPTGFDASDDQCERVVLAWTDTSDSEAGFRLSRDGTQIGVVGPDVTGFIDVSPALDGASHQYGVEVLGCPGSATIRTNQGRAFRLANQVFDLTAGSDRCDAVELSWTDPGAFETGYRVFRDGAPIALVPENTTSYLDETAAIDVTYDYHVAGTNSCGDAPLSNVAQGIVLAGGPTGPTALIAPLGGASCLANPVSLDWDDVPGAREYELEVGTSCGATDVLQTVRQTSDFSSFFPAGEMYWRVRAIACREDPGPWTPCRTFSIAPSTPAAPADFLVQNVGIGVWRFGWSPPAGAERYELVVNEPGVCHERTPSSQVFETTATSLTLDLGVDALTAYVSSIVCDTTGDSTDCLSVSDCGTPDGATVNFLLTDTSFSGCSDGAFIEQGSCQDLASSARSPAFLWIVVSEPGGFEGAAGGPVGIGGFEFGVEHTLGNPTWVHCTTGNQIPDDGWPASGGSMAVTWSDGCYDPEGTNARVGYFQLPNADTGTISIVPAPSVGVVQIVDCNLARFSLSDSQLGFAGLANGTVPVCPTGRVSGPSDLVASTDLCRRVELTWTDDALGREGFQIFRDGTEIATLPPGATAYTDDPETYGQTFTYQVFGLSIQGLCGSPSQVDGAALDTPAPVSDLRATDDACERIALSWTDTGPYETGYRILRDTVFLVLVPADTETYVDTDVVPGVAYAYEVVPTNDCGGAPSEAVVGMAVTGVPPGETALVAPSDGATCVPNPVTLSWQAVAGAADFQVEAGTSCGDASLLSETTTETSISVVAPAAGTIHWRVRARNLCPDAGPWTACRTFSAGPVLPAPEPWTAERQSPGVWRFEWTPVANADHYRLVVSEAGACHQYTPSTQVFSVAAPDTTIDLGTDLITAWVAGVSCAPGDSTGCKPLTPVPVLVESFRAMPARGGADLVWSTGAENGVRGFHVYHEREGLGRVRLTESMIEAGRSAYRFAARGFRTERGDGFVLTEITTWGAELELARTTATAASPVAAHFAVTVIRPNPFNPRTTIRYDVPEAGRVTIDVLDAAGRHVRTLVDAVRERGAHEVIWDGTDSAARALASGSYFVRMRGADGSVSTRRATLLR